MPAVATGDYSRYPEEIQEIIQYLIGECAELHSNWDVFKRLFMEYEERTIILAQYLGPLLAKFEAYLFYDMVFGVCRLLDKDKGKHKNLTLWALANRAKLWDDSFGDELSEDVRRTV